MTTFEIVIAIMGTIIIPFVAYLFKEISELKDKIHELEKTSIAGDELTKKHILNCVNYQPRHNLDK